MSDQGEPFFTAAEWKATIILRPKDWWQWWRAEPVLTKVFSGCLAVVLGCGAYQLRWGNKEVGWGLVATVALLLGSLLVAALVVAFGSIVRWALRRWGLLDASRRLVSRAWKVAVALFWIFIAIGILADFWPYVSLHPVKSWYALKNRIPVENVIMEKTPHDCEFSAAPLGAKNCHYEARTYVTKNGDSPTERALIVSYEKVQD